MYYQCWVFQDLCYPPYISLWAHWDYHISCLWKHKLISISSTMYIKPTFFLFTDLLMHYNNTCISFDYSAFSSKLYRFPRTGRESQTFLGVGGVTSGKGGTSIENVQPPILIYQKRSMSQCMHRLRHNVTYRANCFGTAYLFSPIFRNLGISSVQSSECNGAPINRSS